MSEKSRMRPGTSRFQHWLGGMLVAATIATLPGCLPVAATSFGAGVMMAQDRRSSGAYIEDEGLEWKMNNQLAHFFGDRVHVNATAFNRNLLLTGEVPDDATKAQVDKLARELPNIREVYNELTVAAASSLGARSNDAFITSKVKARLVEERNLSANHVKVVTENGTTYLLGLVTDREGRVATEITRTTAGVRHVVRLFEYISPEQAKRLDARPASERPATVRD